MLTTKARWAAAAVTLSLTLGTAGCVGDMTPSQQKALAATACQAGELYLKSSGKTQERAHKSLNKGLDELDKLDSLDPNVREVVRALRPLSDAKHTGSMAMNGAQQKGLGAACAKVR